MPKIEEFFPVERFTPWQRLQHILLFLATLTLIVTGLSLKFYWTNWSATLVSLMGGAANRALIHRYAAVVLIAVGIVHVLYYILLERGRPFFLKRDVIMAPKDFVDMFMHVKYVLGISNERPKMGRYAWFEKFDYWGAFWGITLMIVTGLSIWYKEIALQFIPLKLIEAFWIAHSDEGVLATLFLLTIHWYNVHYNPEVFPATLRFLHGRTTWEEMELYHPLELEELEKKYGKDELRRMSSNSFSIKALNPLQRGLDSINNYLWLWGPLVVFIMWVIFDMYILKLTLFGGH